MRDLNLGLSLEMWIS